MVNPHFSWRSLLDANPISAADIHMFTVKFLSFPHEIPMFCWNRRFPGASHWPFTRFKAMAKLVGSATCRFHHPTSNDTALLRGKPRGLKWIKMEDFTNIDGEVKRKNCMLLVNIYFADAFHKFLLLEQCYFCCTLRLWSIAFARINKTLVDHNHKSNLYSCNLKVASVNLVFVQKIKRGRYNGLINWFTQLCNPRVLFRFLNGLHVMHQSQTQRLKRNKHSCWKFKEQESMVFTSFYHKYGGFLCGTSTNYFPVSSNMAGKSLRFKMI